MALETGIWTVSANGSNGDLSITSVGLNGALSGTFFSQKIIGFWDDAAQKITFLREINLANDPASIQLYTGYRFTDGVTKKPTITGSFVAYEGAAKAQRTDFGWYATKA